jgi:LAO/AO transport system kinase
MTDIFGLLQLPNAGDDLQAIKKGIMEIADLIVINKADIDAGAAMRAKSQIKTALHMLRPASPNWTVPVLTLSALQKQGIADFWKAVSDYREALTASGEFAAKRRHQALAWMWEMIDSGLRSRFRSHPRVREELPALARAVEEGGTTPAAAAFRLLGHLQRNEQG